MTDPLPANLRRASELVAHARQLQQQMMNRDCNRLHFTRQSPREAIQFARAVRGHSAAIQQGTKLVIEQARHLVEQTKRECGR